MKKDSRIYVAGHRGLVGSAILRKLEEQGYTNLVYKTSKELDLRDPRKVEEFFQAEKIEYVFLAAAKVGGIVANNQYPADFIRDNLMIQTNVIDSAYRSGVERLLFLGSTCIYPKLAPQPLKEEYLLTGELEPTNEPYALAKIAGIKMCESYNRQYGTKYISAMPTNLYGRNDNFDLHTSHVLPALIRKFHEAKENNAEFVEVWGTGTPLREFLYSDDLADACVYLMSNYEGNEIVNIGVGEDLSIKELAEKVKATVGFTGELRFDTSKPDGTPRKLVDVTRINALGWKATTSLDEGLKKAYDWFLQTEKELVRK
ncbi:GDP-L-fucose synthase [Bacillus cereus]|uniref:GDP-L-fucose synthase n=1 Tax=Bacillus TaxID=1386 RepID=UPI0005A3267D|nr:MULTISPECIES: GDP-L-fucose synthase [Bacillus cereus group]AJG58425.1 GDP-L-fucose synthase 1 [Bacillus cereus D17]MCU5056654.1 GDP-L-fucose synthase [Bacillus cereus]QKI12421.1 GDP-L-fucose synthase [Bacillus cereus]USL02346.1 GDP-L-fucose synthase [Bacillus anthracis]SMD69005.1 GDP-L-fucose synthase [Bacillus cereus]